MIRAKPCSKCPALYGWPDPEYAQMIGHYKRGLLTAAEIAYSCAFEIGSICAGIALQAGFNADDVANGLRHKPIDSEVDK